MSASTPDIRLRGLFIDGREVPASLPDALDVVNPATGELLAQIGHASDADVDRAVQSAAAAFESAEWSGMSNRTRARPSRNEYASANSNTGAPGSSGPLM